MRLFPDGLLAFFPVAVLAVACTAGTGRAECATDAQCADLCDTKVAESLAPRTTQLDAGGSYCQEVNQAGNTCNCVNQAGTTALILFTTECAVRGRVGTCLYQPTDTSCSAQSCLSQCEAVQAAIDADNQQAITVQTVGGTCVDYYCHCTARTSVGCVALPPAQSQARVTDCPDGG